MTPPIRMKYQRRTSTKESSTPHQGMIHSTLEMNGLNQILTSHTQANLLSKNLGVTPTLTCSTANNKEVTQTEATTTQAVDSLDKIEYSLKNQATTEVEMQETEWSPKFTPQAHTYPI